MMTALFENKSMPFYKFGDVIYLQKIEKEHLIKYIIKSFDSTGKTIDYHQAELIVVTMEFHPYYVQQLAHLVWLRTENKVNNEIFELALDDFLTQNSPQFIKDIESVSNSQIKFVKALIDNMQNEIYSGKVINKYELGSTSNVTKIIKALIKKEILHKVNSNYELIDPAFKKWLELYYFK